MVRRRARIETRFLVPALLLVVCFTGSVWGQAVHNPRRITAGPQDLILVADRRHNAIIAVDKENLETIWSFALPDEGAPFGLATTRQRIYVGNTETMNVEVYNIPRGSRFKKRRYNPRRAIAEQRRLARPRLEFEYNLGHTTGLIGNPIDIAVDFESLRVFVLDGAEKQVLMFDQHGTLIDTFVPVDQAGEVLSPVSVSIDSARGEVLVGDYGDPSGSFSARKPARILIYSFDGELLFQIDGDGSTDPTTRFARVQGMTVAPDGRVFAADPLAGRILVLDRTTGATIGEVGTPGDQTGELMLPLDVWIDGASGDVFVSNNRGARRVEVFRGAGQ